MEAFTSGAETISQLKRCGTITNFSKIPLYYLRLEIDLLSNEKTLILFERICAKTEQFCFNL